MSGRKEPSVADYPERVLLERAVTNARARNCRKGQKHPRWLAVMDVFVLGRTYARQLCEQFGLDPDEQVKR